MEQVKAHPFFRDVDWAGLRDGIAPFIPALDSEIECVPLPFFLARGGLLISLASRSSGYFDDVRSSLSLSFLL